MRRAKFRILAIAAIVLVAAVQLPAAPAPVKLSMAMFWDMRTFGAYPVMVQEAKTRLNATIEPQLISGSEYTTKILSQIATGTAPDIIMTEVGMIPFMYGNKVLLPLNDYIKKDNLDTSDYWRSLLGRYTVNGVTYCMPEAAGAVGELFYNKKVFADAGVTAPSPQGFTWDQFLQAAQKLTKKDSQGRIVRYGFMGDWRSFVYMFGGSFVDNVQKPTKWTFNSPQTIAGLQAFKDLAFKYQVSPSPEDLAGLGLSDAQMFINQQVTMVQGGCWYATPFVAIKDFDWDIMLMFPGPNGTRAYSTGGNSYGIASTCKNPAVAYQATKLFTVDSSWLSLRSLDFISRGTSDWIPPTMSATKKLKELLVGRAGVKPVSLDVRDTELNYIVFTPFWTHFQEAFDTIINPAIDLALRDKMSIDDAMKQIAPKLEQFTKEQGGF